MAYYVGRLKISNNMKNPLIIYRKRVYQASICDHDGRIFQLPNRLHILHLFCQICSIVTIQHHVCTTYANLASSMGRFGWFLWCVLLDVLCIRANVLLHTLYRFGRIFDIQHRISNMLYDVVGKVQVRIFERNKYDGKHKYIIAVTWCLLNMHAVCND